MKTIFAVVAVNNPTVLAPVIAQYFPSDSLLIAQGQWLIAAEGTAQSVCEKLGINDPTPTVPTTALVVSVSGYFGRLNPNVWEWIKSKWGTA